jgi:hypothetical protein
LIAQMMGFFPLRRESPPNPPGGVVRLALLDWA